MSRRSLSEFAAATRGATYAGERADLAKEILVRWIEGENLNIAAMEMARLIVEASNKAYEEGYGDGATCESWRPQFEL